MNPILFAVDSATSAALPAAASLLVGAAVVTVVYWLVSSLTTADLEQQDDWRFDVSRINELRRQDVFYRSFQPLVQLLARFNRSAFREHLPLIQREIQAAGQSRFWLAEEYLARAELVAIFLLPIYAYFAVRWVGWGGLIIALGAAVATAWLLRRRLAGQARYRLRAIKRRMPFLLDLLTLLMGAGSTFLNALRQSVAEFAGDAVAVEFGRVLADMNLGKTRTEAFEAMRNRLDDDEITAIIGSILQGEALGTPLADIFRTQADVLRIKRSQRAERIAGEAGVNMLLPGILIMVSTVLVIIGPFMLNYLSFGFSF